MLFIINYGNIRGFHEHGYDFMSIIAEREKQKIIFEFERKYTKRKRKKNMGETN